MTAKTELDYWQSGYETKTSISPVDFDNPRTAINLHLKRRFDALNLAHKQRVLEVGGGGSEWLSRFALDFPESEFLCLDYSSAGCNLIEEFAQKNQLNNLKAVNGDFFDTELEDYQANLLYSIGVVEHFEDLQQVLSVLTNHLAHQGEMLTFIPNMSGVLGTLTKRFNPSVYDIHVPHNLEGFVEAHEKANLEVVSSGYLGCVNFGVLSSCFTQKTGFNYQIYKWLSRLSKFVWMLELKGLKTKESAMFSPYIYCHSRLGG